VPRPVILLGLATLNVSKRDGQDNPDKEKELIRL
jgi:hypothetical protein